MQHFIGASDASAYRDALDQLRELHEAKAAADQALVEEREQSTAEIRHLRNQQSEIMRENQDRLTRLNNELEALRSAAEHEATVRNALEGRHTELLASVEDQGRRLASALSDATRRTKYAEVISLELERVRAEAEESRRVQTATDERLTTLLAEQAETLRKLEEARARGEDLEEQINFARAEGDEAFRALNEATREKDRLLRTQTMEADRLLRDHIAEADGDRAVLEHQFSELQAKHDGTERTLQEALMELDVSKADIAGLREELQRTQHEIIEAQAAKLALREDLARVKDKVDEQARRLTSTDHLLADILEIAVSFRDTDARVMASIQKTLAHASKPSPRHAMADSLASVAKSAPSTGIAAADALAIWTTPVDLSDPATSIDILKQFDLDAFTETILKSGSTIRKWQKQCKDYRERARGKIAFRDFTKGDLALFLPTRNAILKPWAAFNGTICRFLSQS
jgi:autophagy-related protein 11